MKLKLSCIFLAMCLLVPISLLSQDNNDVRWSQDPSTRVRVIGEYPNLPFSVTYENPNKETRAVTTPAGTLFLAPNIRPFPHTATQSEIDVTSMRSNPDI